MIIVAKGEFEINKVAEFNNEEELTANSIAISRQIIGDGSTKGARQKKMLKKLDANVANKNVKLSLLGVGLVFGDDDILTNRPYKATLKCVTNDSLVYLL